MDEQYIFNIPKNHISALLHTVYPNCDERHSLVNQECGEFLQAFSKYTLVRNRSTHTLSEFKETREKLVEEMTHVLVCFGMLAFEQNITQDEIDAKIREKAIKGVEYPFDITPEKKHVSIEALLKGLERCRAPRYSIFHTDPETSCNGCTFKDSNDYTVICRPMIEEALYYLNKFGEHKRSIEEDRMDNGTAQS